MIDQYKLVPVEPTPEMLKASDYMIDCDPIWMARAYRAMLAAAPQPSAEAVATVEVMMTGGNAGIATRIVENDDPLRERLLPGTKLYTHTPDDTALLRQALDTLTYWLEYGEDCDSEWWIARVGSTEQIAYTVPVRPGVARANARRLVACWNACEGISTDALERLGTLDRARVDLDVIRAQAIAQRDELLEALRMVMACAGDISAAPDGLLEMALDDGDEETRRQANAFLVARAAIAKAEGGAA